MIKVLHFLSLLCLEVAGAKQYLMVCYLSLPIVYVQALKSTPYHVALFTSSYWVLQRQHSGSGVSAKDVTKANNK